MPETAPAAAPQQQQAPFGQSPATGPTPNKGFEAAAAQRLGMVVKQLEEIIGTAGATSEIGQAALKMLNIGVKMVPPGAVSPASAKNNIEQMAMKNTQQAQQMAALKAQSQGGGQPGAQPGAAAPPMMPKAA
jgi:hypothetical protein